MKETPFRHSPVNFSKSAVTACVDPHIFDQFDALCRRQNVSRSARVRQLIEDFVSKEGEKA